MRQFVRTTIAEPFPVLGLPSDGRGPFYAAGSEWFDLPPEANEAALAQTLVYRQRAAEGLRQHGFTVTVETIKL